MTDQSLDLTGLGKALDALPDDAKQRPIHLICETIEKLIRPATATTDGIGRWIESKFDSLIEPQQRAAQAVLVDAVKKTAAAQESGSKENGSPKPRVVVEAIEGASLEGDPVLQQLWSNLLAQELRAGDIHPEMVNTLTKLAPADAHALIELAKGDDGFLSALARAISGVSITTFPIALSWPKPSAPWSFSHQHLRELGLISDTEGSWRLTKKGEAMLHAVSDPSLADVPPDAQTSTGDQHA